ncbi:hypothetical protein ACFFSY_23335 [Paenibacillus aurantiacus]|uniref:Uncharacterized protein n=1 Tax=Paenibacillus aurantiacus TaxID=1936118 RepID=A0ABV5KUJ7_9BACL
MNRHVFYILVSIGCFIFPLAILIYGYWDAYQPKVGPVGDGEPNLPTFAQILPLAAMLLLSLVNIPIAIIRYKAYNNSKAQDGESKDR